MTRKHFAIMAGALLFVSICAYLGLKYYIEADAKSRIQQWANQTDRISGLTFQSLEVGLFAKTIQARQVSIKFKDSDRPVAIDRLVLHSFDIHHEIPSFMHVEMQGIHIRPDDSFIKGAAPVLSQLGYTGIEADAEYAYRYDPIKNDLEIQQARIRVADMGQLEITARLNNLDLAVIKSVPSSPLTLVAMLPAVAISGITLKYRDDSMTQRLVQFGARQSGQSKEQFVSGLIDRLSLEIQKQNPPAVKDGLQAVQKFIENPAIIEVAVSPLQPVPLMRFALMDHIGPQLDLLNIAVTYQKDDQKR